MDELMEYLFFDEALAKRFQAYCQAQGVESQIEQSVTHTDDDAFNVQISQTMSEAQTEAIEERYSDMLFGEQAAQIEGQEQSGLLADACGVQVQLQSGQFTTVAIHPEIMNKILSVLTITELQTFLSQVAEDIENPKSGPICARDDLPTI